MIGQVQIEGKFGQQEKWERRQLCIRKSEKKAKEKVVRNDLRLKRQYRSQSRIPEPVKERKLNRNIEKFKHCAISNRLELQEIEAD